MNSDYHAPLLFLCVALLHSRSVGGAHAVLGDHDGVDIAVLVHPLVNVVEDRGAAREEHDLSVARQRVDERQEAVEVPLRRGRGRRVGVSVKVEVALDVHWLLLVPLGAELVKPLGGLWVWARRRDALRLR